MLDHPAVANDVPNPTTNPDQPPTAGLTITQAAQRCGVTREAIRLRIRRGTLPAHKVNGQWVVFLNDPPTPTANGVGEHDQAVPPNPTTNPDENTVPYPVLVAQMEREIQFLREQLTVHQHQLDEAARDRSELRQLLAIQVSHALPPPRTPADGTPSATDETDPADQPRRRRWWWPFPSASPQ
jgi:hypothetical protein